MQDTSDIKIDCYAENKLRNEKICNVSAPFMRAKSQVRSSRFQFLQIFNVPHAAHLGAGGHVLSEQTSW